MYVWCVCVCEHVCVNTCPYECMWKPEVVTLSLETESLTGLKGLVVLVGKLQGSTVSPLQL